jgi:hypothetical protein
MVMKIKDLPAAASFTFEGACATGMPVHSLGWEMVEQVGDRLAQ